MTLDNGQIIVLKDKKWIKRQKIAGDVIKNIHHEFFKMIKGMSKNLTLSSLEKVANNIIDNSGCTPTFLHYRGFPTSVCASLNKELVHGFANRDIILQSGDVLTLDVGVTFQSAIADCAVTYIYGKPKDDKIMKLLFSCQNALYDAIEVFKPGNKIGEIGNVIHKKSKDDGFGVITMYGGHGIDSDMLHASPFIANKSKSSDGVIIRPGMSIAIEPMFVFGKNTNTKILNDKWTVITKEIGVHFEHSVTIDEDGNKHIITDHKIFVKDFI
jgi:methionyl aminopeptidase